MGLQVIKNREISVGVTESTFNELRAYISESMSMCYWRTGMSGSSMPFALAAEHVEIVYSNMFSTLIHILKYNLKSRGVPSVTICNAMHAKLEANKESLVTNAIQKLWRENPRGSSYTSPYMFEVDTPLYRPRDQTGYSSYFRYFIDHYRATNKKGEYPSDFLDNIIYTEISRKDTDL